MNDGHSRVLRHQGIEERFKIQNLVPTVKGSKGIMVAACMSYNGVGGIIHEEGKVNAHCHIKTLTNTMIPELRKLGNDDLSSVVFQEDNAPVHTAKKSQEFKNMQGIITVSWPAQSPDLNPIEHLWSYVDRQLRHCPQCAKNENDLWEMVTDEWRQIPMELTRRLIDSMPNRLHAVIAANGYPTWY